MVSASSPLRGQRQHLRSFVVLARSSQPLPPAPALASGAASRRCGSARPRDSRKRNRAAFALWSRAFLTEHRVLKVRPAAAGVRVSFSVSKALRAATLFSHALRTGYSVQVKVPWSRGL